MDRFPGQRGKWPGTQNRERPREEPHMPGTDDIEQRRTMRYWISTVLREAREEAGVPPKNVAQLADVDNSTLSRFENHRTWPQNLDRMVAAYALIAGVEDPRDLWREAVQRYVKDGGQPVLGELSPAQRSLRLALEAAQRQTPYADESRPGQTSIHPADRREESTRPRRRRSR